MKENYEIAMREMINLFYYRGNKPLSINDIIHCTGVVREDILWLIDNTDEFRWKLMGKNKKGKNIWKIQIKGGRL